MAFSLSIKEFFKYKHENINKQILDEMKLFVCDKMTNKKIRRSRFRSKKFKKPRTRIQHSWRREPPKDFKVTWSVENKKKRSEDEKIYSKMRGILNKLSGKNFNKLAKQVLSLDITTQKQLLTLTDIVFRKAINESFFCGMYARLCINFAKKQKKFEKMLSEKCNKMFVVSISFEKELGEKVNTGYSEFRYKDNVVGCAMFIGELYNGNFFDKKMIEYCFTSFLEGLNLNKVYMVSCICKLMKTIGNKYCKENPISAKIFFEKFKILENDKRLKFQQVCYIMDLFDLKKEKKWLD